MAMARPAALRAKLVDGCWLNRDAEAGELDLAKCDIDRDCDVDVGDANSVDSKSGFRQKHASLGMGK